MSVIGCRHCGRPVWYRQPSDAPHFPFCSRRCRLADLGKWFDEEHRLSAPLADAQNGPLPPTEQDDERED